MEYEGEVVSLGNTDTKIKNLMRSANVKDMEVKAKQARIEELECLLAEAKERISHLLGEKMLKTRRKKATGLRLKKYPGERARKHKEEGTPKRQYSPEKLEKLKQTMANARRVRMERIANKTERSETIGGSINA